MRIWIVATAVCCAVMGASAAAEVGTAIRKQTSIPAQGLEPALYAFYKERNIQVVYRSEVVKNLTTAGAQGELTADEVLKRLLSGTGLTFQYLDAKTVTIVPQGQSAPTQSSGMAQVADLRLAQAAATGASLQRVAEVSPGAADRPVQGAEPGAVTGEDEVAEVQVTGSRIRSLLGEQSTQPVLTITREDIEHYGVSSLAEVLRYVPQVSSTEQGQRTQKPTALGPPFMDVNANRVTATLRGAPAGGTLLLVNGRRVAKNGQGNVSGNGDAYDLGGIPLSAVERIDVLLDGASAVYGADAVGGVINVILKKNYTGTEARVGYENTFDTDVSVRSVSLAHGFAAGKLSGMLTGAWEAAGGMMWNDRTFLRSFDRSPYGGPNLDSPYSWGYGGAGVVQSLSGNLPGLGTAIAAIPSGSTGTGLTVADYANAGPLPPSFNQTEYFAYSTPYDRKSATGSLEYAFSDSLTAFAEARWSDSHTVSTGTPGMAFMITVPAGAPGNPFGVPVLLSKYFYDLALPESRADSTNASYTAGLRGRLFRDWRYEAAASRVSTSPDYRTQNGYIDEGKVTAALAGANPPVLMYDSTRGNSPNAPGVIEALYDSMELDGERSWTMAYDVHADGSLFALPAGDVQLSVGMEYRDEHVEFPVAQRTLSVQSDDRYTSGLYAEAQVPLLSEKQNMPMVRRLTANLAVRNDRYNDFPESTNARYGLLYKPFDWLMLRGSRGEGYKVPTLVQLYQPFSTGFTAFPPGIFFDAARGGETIDGIRGGQRISVTRTGNANLRPERSRNTTAGAVLEVPFVRGLSFSVDYFDTEYLDRVSAITLQDRIVLFPDTVVRGPNLPTDPAGWPGPVIGYNEMPYNIATNHITGYDIGVKYRHSTDIGDWTAQATGSKTTRYEIRTAPGLAPTSASTILNLPLQVVGSLFWTRSAVSTGALFTYRDQSQGTTLTGPMVPSAIRWDWQGSYDFGRSGITKGGGSRMGRLLADTRISLTIFNVLNKRPPFYSGLYLPDNTVVDSRLRRYALSLVRDF